MAYAWRVFGQCLANAWSTMLGMDSYTRDLGINSHSFSFLNKDFKRYGSCMISIFLKNYYNSNHFNYFLTTKITCF